MPPSFKTSMGTLHRILTYVREGTIRRVGTALVISPAGNPNLVLVGNDVATPRLYVGKPYGTVSLPMGYARRTESRERSLLRVLQQEVFTEEAIAQTLPAAQIVGKSRPFMFLDIADVRVSVYHLTLPNWLSEAGSFSSFKLKQHRYLHFRELIAGGYNFRSGIREIGVGYKRFLEEKKRDFIEYPVWERALLNVELALSPALE
jgi:hypothetical protein